MYNYNYMSNYTIIEIMWYYNYSSTYTWVYLQVYECLNKFYLYMYSCEYTIGDIQNENYTISNSKLWKILLIVWIVSGFRHIIFKICLTNIGRGNLR